MSTNDVPGAKAGNADTLAMGCWAEHDDGSLIFVESTEGSRVIYSIFDMAKDPPVEYRDAMPEVSFKKTFSFDPNGVKPANEKWTWHDKTPFDWDRVIKHGAKDGPRLPSADQMLNAAERIVESRTRHATAAERVAESLALEGRDLDKTNLAHRIERIVSAAEGIVGSIATALDNMGKRKAKKPGRSARR